MVLLFAVGCGATTPLLTSSRATPRTSDSTLPPLEAPATPTLGDGVTPMTVACREDNEERCNALDDDCDGHIDGAECGYATGPLQVTATWNSGADLDLYVTDPSGEMVSFQRRRSASGAHLDHAARGAGTEQPQPRIESLVFEERPPPGEYHVELHYLFECETNAGSATATISLSVAGEIVGTYNYTLSPNERATILRFELQ